MTSNKNDAPGDDSGRPSTPAIQTSWPGQCFGCSPANQHGLKLQFTPTEHGCTTECKIPDHLCGFDGIVHGGIISTLLDEAAAWTLVVQLGQLGLTTELNIRYQHPVPTAASLLVEGMLIHHDEKTAKVRSAVRAVSGQPLAVGESSWRLTTLKRFSEIMDVPAETLQRFFRELRAELPSQQGGNRIDG